eukprot:scaffold67901_cov29-Tisochrysis_lutea.AAC.1
MKGALAAAVPFFTPTSALTFVHPGRLILSALKTLGLASTQMPFQPSPVVGTDLHEDTRAYQLGRSRARALMTSDSSLPDRAVVRAEEVRAPPVKGAAEEGEDELIDGVVADALEGALVPVNARVRYRQTERA